MAQSDSRKNSSKLFLAFSSDSPITAEGAAAFTKGWLVSLMPYPQLPTCTEAAHGPQSNPDLTQSRRWELRVNDAEHHEHSSPWQSISSQETTAHTPSACTTNCSCLGIASPEVEASSPNFTLLPDTAFTQDPESSCRILPPV